MIDCAHVHAAVRRGESLAGSDVVEHVSTCPACAVLVAAPIVAHGLETTSGDDGGDLASLLARTKARVATETGWRAKLRAKSTPVRSAIGLFVVAAIPLLVLAAAPRADLGIYPIARLVAESVGYIATAIAAAVIGLWPLQRADPRTGRALAVVAAIGAAVVVASLPAAHHDHPASLAGDGEDFIKRALGCFAYGTSCAIPTWVALRLLARSRSNYALLGGLRATAQMISYEIALGISIIGVVMVYGTMDLQELVRGQGKILGGWIPLWGIVVQPVAFFVFLTAALAETKRVPFDLPEGESEIIGYFTEYSGMKFGMFFLTDFLETIMVACLATTLFFGGWQVPYLMPDGFHFPWGGTLPISHWAYVLLGVASFSTKVLVFCWLFMQLRWTLPRFRYDQLMRLGWLGLFPISVANVLVTASVLVFFGEGS